MGTRLYQDVEWEGESDSDDGRERRDELEPDWGRGLIVVMLVVFLLAVTSEAWAGRSQDAHRKGHRDGKANAAQGADPAGDDTEVLGEIIIGPPAPVTESGVSLFDIVVTAMLLTLSGAGTYACARSLWEGRRRARAEARSAGDGAPYGINP